MLQKIIIEYLSINSRGLINLSAKQAKDIINIVTGYKPQASANALLYHCPIGKAPELIRTISTTNQAINQAILKGLKDGPQMGFYTFELYNDAQEYQGAIYTVNPHLFD